jgi:hypothetical protein
MGEYIQGVRWRDLFTKNTAFVKHMVDLRALKVLPNGFILEPPETLSPDLRRRFAAERRSMKAAVRSRDAIVQYCISVMTLLCVFLWCTGVKLIASVIAYVCNLALTGVCTVSMYPNYDVLFVL